MVASTFTFDDEKINNDRSSGRSSSVKPPAPPLTAVPATMSDALDCDDPEAALRSLAEASAMEAEKQAAELLANLQDFSLDLPKLLVYNPKDNNNKGGAATAGESKEDSSDSNTSSHPHHHPLRHATACADSIYESLTKIAVGGSQASQEIRQLEQEKEAMEVEASCIATALALRQAESQTNAAWQIRDFATAARTIQPWLHWKQQQPTLPPKGKQHAVLGKEQEDQVKMHKRVVAFAGEYSLEQLERIYQQLQQVLLQKYEQAVQQSNLQLIGNYTPLLGKLQLEPKAVELYLQFLKGVLHGQLLAEEQKLENEQQQQQQQQQSNSNSFNQKMAKVYNVSVSTLRHHLPMVSHCLFKANGDIAVVQLVHEQCSEKVLPLWRSYQRERQLGSVRRHAERIADLFQQGDDEDDNAVDPAEADASFTTHIGSLSDVDSAMEEAALCIQHAESYLRFMQHTCNEVNRARHLRYEKQYYATSSSNSSEAKDQAPPPPFKPVEILSPSTPLHEMVAEVGGQYVVIERCLMLASMHRAYAAETNLEDAKHYRPLTVRSPGAGGGGRGGGGALGGMYQGRKREPLQTVLVETCFYTARRSTQRAFFTGHSGTASAMANFCVEALSSTFLDVLRQRAEEFGVAHLKPGDGLLVGSANYFTTTTAAMIGRPQGSAAGSIMMKGAAASKQDDEERRQIKVAQACALLNDIHVAVHHTEQLTIMLNEAIAKGFPSNTHATEQLVLCVKSFSTVQDQFRAAADGAIESLESILKPRIRSIVGEAVGSESSSSTFIVSPVMGKQSNASGSMMGGGGAGGSTTRMNYNLDEEAYNFLQLSEGYMARLFALLEELVEPLKQYLAPVLWDSLWLNIIGTTAKRLETLLRKTNFTAMGALAFDSDVRDFVSFTRGLLRSDTYKLASNAAVTKTCVPLGRLSQLSKLLNVDEVEDLLDVISSLKRKGDWDWKLEDIQSFLTLRFPQEKVQNVLRLKD
ncbi:hypothetical protein ACA910_000617 [Epithemia clementina (nom. ined.)]